MLENLLQLDVMEFMVHVHIHVYLGYNLLPNGTITVKDDEMVVILREKNKRPIEGGCAFNPHLLNVLLGGFELVHQWL